MKFSIKPKPVTFEAAHTLEQFCPGIHGHTYRVSVRVEGDVGEDGVVADFRSVRALVKAATAALDHRLLNNAMSNPTAERVAEALALAIASGLRIDHPGARLVSLSLFEGDNEVEVQL